MSLLSFLEFGGEAVVRGILSRLDPSVILQRGRLTVLAEGFVKEALSRKGYDRFGFTASEIRDVIVRAARSLNVARRLMAGEPVGLGGATGIPTFPTATPGDITYTVKITYRNPDGTTSDAVTEVQSSRELGRAEVREAALANAATRSGWNSDPAEVLGSGRAVESVQVISIYSGEVIRP